MAQEMSFAQALTEARQIIVQQSNRIKSDLDRIKAMQETITSQTGTISENERNLRQKVTELEAMAEQIKTLTTKYDEIKLAREQAEAVIDRQGQRLAQMQDAVAGMEKQVAELTSELNAVRAHMTTQEDDDALAALTQLLSTKKSGVAAKIGPSGVEDSMTTPMAA
jgi:chromosome segregation ATPase